MVRGPHSHPFLNLGLWVKAMFCGIRLTAAYFVDNYKHRIQIVSLTPLWFKFSIYIDQLQYDN
jgi:hypothetical protein